MKKLWWLLPVALLAAGSLVFMACPTGGGGSRGGDDDDEIVPFEYDDIVPFKGWGSSAPTIDSTEGWVSVNASSSTGWYLDFADIKYTYDARDTLILTYEIEITTPAAVVTLKNPKSTSSWIDTVAPSDYGIGKGREFWLGNTANSNYKAGEGGKLVNGTYDDTKKEGTIEVVMAYLGAATGIAFQHNVWADTNGDGTKVAENSEYKVRFTYIENPSNANPPPPPGGDSVKGSLGAPTYQKGDGDTDGKESQMAWEIDVDDLDGATIELVFGNAITGGWQLILQTKTTSESGFSGWNQSQPSGDDGKIKTEIDYAEISADMKTITIDVDAWFDDEDLDFSDKDQVKFVFAYYSGDTKARSLDIKSADLK